MNILEQTMQLIAEYGLNADLHSDKLALRLEGAGLLRSDPPDEGEVMSFRTTGNNSHLIEDCFRLGYLTDDMAILDPTYGMGVFWKRHRPPFLVGSDIDPTKSPGGATGLQLAEPGQSIDFTALPWMGMMFNAVVFDPDYKLQGTSSNEGPASSNARYGMDREYRAVTEQLGIIGGGLVECVRVCKPGGVIAVKAMDQVVSGNTVFMTDMITLSMDDLGCDKFAVFHLEGNRKQPTHDICRSCNGSGESGPCVICVYDAQGDPWPICEACGGEGKVPRRQVHERHNFSTLALYRKAKT